MTCLYRYICIFLFLTHYSLLHSQNYVTGKISDERGKPVSFASVKFAEDSAGPAKAFSISIITGGYNLAIGKMQNGWISVSAVGYNQYFKFIRIKENDTLFENITLVTSSKTLPEVKIRNKPSIDISGDTTSYTVDRFKRGNEGSVSDLLKNIPGFTQGPGGVLIYNGKVIDKVLLNGDNLTGKNYSKLITGLDVQGIDKFQVIQNYAANDDLISSFMGGKEQVLNIAYKKGFLNKIFGTVEGSLGVPIKYYNEGLQVLGLFDKVKILSINRINSVGKMNTSPGATQIPEDIRVDPENDIELAPRPPMASINDLSTGIEEVSPFYKNNSAASGLNFLVKPAKDFTIRGDANYIYDNFNQQMSSTSQYFTQPFFEIDKSNKISRKPRRFEGLLSFNYFPDSKNQLHFTLKNSGNHNLSSANTKLSGNIDYSEKLTGNNEQMGFKFIYNHLFRREAAFSFSAQYKHGSLPGLYTVSPAVFQDFFGFPGVNDIFSQHEYQRQSSLVAQSKVIKKWDRHTFTFGCTWKKLQDQSINSIEAQSLQQNNWVGIDSINNKKMSWVTTGIIAQDSWLVNKKLSISLSTELQYYGGRLNNQLIADREKSVNGLLFLPGVKVGYKISKENTLNFSYNSFAKSSEPSNSGYGYSVRDITSVSKNLDTLQLKAAKSLTLFYSNIDLLGKKFVFISGLSFSQIPLLALSQIHPYQTYTYNEILPSNKISENLNLFVSGYKFYNGYRTQIVPSINFSKGSVYTILQNKVTKVGFNQVQVGVGYNTEIKNLQIKSNLRYTIKNQKLTNTISNKYLTAICGLSLKLKSNLFADVDVKYFFLKTNNQSSNKYVAISAKIQYNSQNEKWQYRVTGTNLLNHTSYSSAILSGISAFRAEYQLFPRTVMFFIKYNF